MSGFIFVEEELLDEKQHSDVTVQIPIATTPKTKNTRESVQSEKRKKTNTKLLKTTLDLIPIRRVYNNQCFETHDGQLIDLYQIESKDIYSLNDQEIDMHLYQFQLFQRQFLDDYKLISMNFPVNTSSQQGYLHHVLRRTTDRNRRFFLEKELERQEFLEKTQVNKEYYLMIFANDSRGYNDQIRLINGFHSGFTIRPIELEKKKKILSKMMNMNSKV